MLYRERRFGAKRDFRIVEDGVLVHGERALVSEYDIKVPFSIMLKDVSKMRVRRILTIAGVVAILYAIAMVGFVTWAPAPGKNWIMFIIECVLIVAGIVLILLLGRKVEFAQFRNSGGIPVLDMARAGPDMDKFDEFVKEIADRIGEQELRQ